ncbi:hypothetical protein [Mycobacteroides abscessus]|uniref:hypothetical protein n=1 Tax=Mycobacteroides abscessus TaxID=36809 RepID=UPI00092ABA32|nr:hypothetical protein [Mycobacteroides abscessus]DAZ90294.1 TPA_asm: hypothetical protein PROPHIFSQJ01-1_8 [Mycobacterium phage prophiFSQJ01-1]SII40150.1 Uncharacterised protein [Mycobacteroides abscessus subsp. abscessus]SIK15142.1 Uncharacterised protein [Mycobacteroides abscessus subsp. abscessus]SIN24781.1 Uncharacterised protein [Mycobacteroides abscessus subsp. abscessus]SLI52141.1 Uncharacterised protein [Mycobacteroides abscessus subsp. abscessus]
MGHPTYPSGSVAIGVCSNGDNHVMTLLRDAKGWHAIGVDEAGVFEMFIQPADLIAQLVTGAEMPAITDDEFYHLQEGSKHLVFKVVHQPTAELASVEEGVTNG